MLATKLRAASRRVGALASCAVKRSLGPTCGCQTVHAVAGSATTTTPRRFISTADEKAFQEMGLLDDHGLTIFETLHEMQVNSCQVFAQNELFGTYDDASKKFQYMTYDDYAQKVNQCRSLLKDLGKFECDTCRTMLGRRRISRWIL
jgi:hypothetical protein